jgi:hypothetical protein
MNTTTSHTLPQHLKASVWSGALPTLDTKIPLRAEHEFRAGGVHAQLSFWSHITKGYSKRDEVMRWIREGVDASRFFIPFNGVFKGSHYVGDSPSLYAAPNHLLCDTPEFCDFVQARIDEGLSWGAIVPYDGVPQVVCPLSIEPTKPRLVCDARFTNLWTKESPFSLPSIHSLLPWMGGLGAKADLKSGYFHVFVSIESRNFFCFRWKGVLYCYAVLSFGWRASPYVFQTMMMAVVHYAARAGVPIGVYLDDFFWSCEVKGVAPVAITRYVYGILYMSGLVVAVRKSTLQPSAVLELLGMILDFKAKRIWIPAPKKAAFTKLLASILQNDWVSTSTLQRFVGKATALTVAVSGAKWFTREQYWAVSASVVSGNSSIYLHEDLRWELSQWVPLVDTWEGAAFPRPAHLGLVLHTDASSGYWGGRVYASPEARLRLLPPFGGPIPAALANTHIQVKEAFALVSTLRLLGPQVENLWIDVGIDNMAVLWAANMMRSKSVGLWRRLREIAFIQRQYNLRLSYHYVPSKLNTADEPSRPDRVLECSLQENIWRVVEYAFGPHDLDYMATALNSRCASFFSQFTCAQALGTNVLGQSLVFREGNARWNGYAFPPFSMIPHLLDHAWGQGATFTLIAPYEPSAMWWARACQRASFYFYLAKPGPGVLEVLFPGKPKSPIVSRRDLWCFRFDPTWSGPFRFRGLGAK